MVQSWSQEQSLRVTTLTADNRASNHSECTPGMSSSGELEKHYLRQTWHCLDIKKKKKQVCDTQPTFGSQLPLKTNYTALHHFIHKRHKQWSPRHFDVFLIRRGFAVCSKCHVDCKGYNKKCVFENREVVNFPGIKGSDSVGRQFNAHFWRRRVS